MSGFVHIHNHSHYSTLDALPGIVEMIEGAVQNNQTAVGLTDHGVMFGTIEFYRESRARGIKPLVGLEAYIANGSRFDKNLSKNGPKRRNYFHVLLLAKDQRGYHNLLKLTSLGHTEGFYYRPRIDKELLERYHEGLVCTSACLGGVVSAHFIDGNFDLARSEAQYYKDLFGDDFYLEIQNHGLEHDPLILDEVPALAKQLDIKLVATNDIHYMRQEHAYAHNLLLNIRDSAPGQANIKDLRYGTAEYYFKSSEQMIQLFGDYPDACKNTVEIADKCNVEIDLKTLYMPEFPIPKTSQSTNLDEYLTELVYEGLVERYGNPIPDHVKERADYELKVITDMKFPGYFLIVADFIRAARELGVSVGPGRGSAAGSIIAYALKITNVDPLPYDLLFERFLNPERVSMPDIDIDFADDKRERVIDYVKEKYGANAVAQIVTFGKLSTRQVITDVGRVLGIELSTVKDITAKIPVMRGKVMKLAKAIELPELKWLTETDDQRIKDLLEYALVLENKNRNTSIHAAGVVIAPGEVSDYCPVYQSAANKDVSGDVVTQYSGGDLESAGLVKMDFLGLRTLSIIDNSLEMIKKNHGIDIDIDAIDFLDKKTYDLIGEGNTLAIFQFESGGMQEYLRRLKPQNLEDITAMNALYRPGPMDNIPDFIDRKNGVKPIEYLHDIMARALKNTYGIIVYQEQVMQLCQDIGGFTLGQADVLRRAMGKKKIAEMDKMKPVFIDGAAKHGISEKLALEIFDLIYKFADYGFNKSHSLAYSYLAYQTAWLKANYPAEFLAANMTAELNDQNKIVALIDEAKKFGIRVLPPDINRSETKFIAEDGAIFFGMAAIKNVGKPAVDSIVETRQAGNFTSFFDFVSRVDTRLINKRTLEGLICAGAFDSLNSGHRAALMEMIEPGLEYAKAIAESKNSSMDSLFGGGEAALPSEPPLPNIPEWSEKLRLEKEKQVLNFYVSGHPLNRFEIPIKSIETINVAEFTEEESGGYVRIGGLITDVRVRMDKKENKIAFVQIEDFYGKAELIFWSDAFKKFEQYLQTDNVILCSGKSGFNGELVKVVVDEVLSVEEALKKFGAGYKVWIDLNGFDDNKIDILKNELCGEGGSDTRIHFYVKDDTRDYKNHLIGFDAGIDVNENNTVRLAELFGTSKVRLALKRNISMTNGDDKRGRRYWADKNKS